MNEAELQTLMRSHYENEAQTLTTGAEANLLKLKEMRGLLTEADQQRWADIKAIFLKQQRAKGYGENGMAQAVETMEDISGSLRGIAEALQKKWNDSCIVPLVRMVISKEIEKYDQWSRIKSRNIQAHQYSLRNYYEKYMHATAKYQSRST